MNSRRKVENFIGILFGQDVVCTCFGYAFGVLSDKINVMKSVNKYMLVALEKNEIAKK